LGASLFYRDRPQQKAKTHPFSPVTNHDVPCILIFLAFLSRQKRKYSIIIEIDMTNINFFEIFAQEQRDPAKRILWPHKITTPEAE
jgi:hypothetical protein